MEEMPECFYACRGGPLSPRTIYRPLRETTGLQCIFKRPKSFEESMEKVAGVNSELRR